MGNNFVIIFVIYLMLFMMLNRQKQDMVTTAHRLIKRKRNGERSQMEELARKFIEKNCIIATLNNQYSGVITEVADGAILVDNGKETSVINLDFVTCIREHKRKSKESK